MHRARTPLALLITLLLAACASAPRSSTFEVEPGAYADAFEAATDELRRAGFELDRVDARAGVITTLPRESAGFWTPWVTDEQSLGDEIGGALNAERRVVSVRFAGAGPEDRDLRDFDAGLLATVEVEVRRLYRPGRTLESASVRLIGQYRDAHLARRGVQPDITVSYGDDPELAASLADRLRSRNRTH